MVTSLTMSAMVPLTILAFSLPLPYLPPSPAVGSQFVAGIAILTAGLLLYNFKSWAPALQSWRRKHSKEKAL